MSKRPHFIHIPKNGGMTVRHAPELKQVISISSPKFHKSTNYTYNLHTQMAFLGDHHGDEHARFRDLNPKLWNTCQPFAFIRNPWDRVVSRYFFAKKVIEVEKKVSKSYADVSSFEAFLEERHKWGSEPYMWHRAVRGWYSAFDHVCDDMGIVKCDILRFESYDEDFKTYFGIKNSPRKRNVTALNKSSYIDIYDKKSIQIIADWYQKDIETWGYDFDTGPTKNTWNNA